MGKSKKNVSYSLSGSFDFETKVITEYNKDGDIVGEHNLDDVLSEFDNHDVSISVKRSSEI